LGSAWVPGAIFGIDTSDLFFLGGVFIVWYIVGRAIDRRGTQRPEGPRAAITLAVSTFLLAVGGLFYSLGLHDLRYPPNLNPVGAVLTLTWSASLIVLSGRALIRMVRRLRSSA
jgi:hypothetical protein